MEHHQREHSGFILGAIAVSSFSFTLPMSRLAVEAIDPWLVGFGRAFCAALIALIVVIVGKLPRPTKHDIKPLFMAGVGVTLAFPFLSSLAMKTLPASHGAIVTGLLPLATAGWISWQHHERPSKRFWFAALVGSLTVLCYAFVAGGGVVNKADGLLLLAVIFGAIGYAEGGKLAKVKGGIFVMTWALMLMLPILTVIMFVLSKQGLPLQAKPTHWFAFWYLTLISQYGGMIVWYRALGSGSVAKLSQVQLLQPFLTVFVAHTFFNEHVSPMTYAAAFIVLGCVLVAKQSKIRLKSA